jgi:uncharacterized protein (DUF736 family)
MDANVLSSWVGTPTNLIDIETGSALERVDERESYRSVAADTPSIGRSTYANIAKNEDLRA